MYRETWSQARGRRSSISMYMAYKDESFAYVQSHLRSSSVTERGMSACYPNRSPWKRHLLERTLSASEPKGYNHV